MSNCSHLTAGNETEGNQWLVLDGSHQVDGQQLGLLRCKLCRRGRERVGCHVLNHCTIANGPDVVVLDRLQGGSGFYSSASVGDRQLCDKRMGVCTDGADHRCPVDPFTRAERHAAPIDCSDT
jgi:hypothetical protein